jgi:cell fate regulator YaaT (PSP1 superfamily)
MVGKTQHAMDRGPVAGRVGPPRLVGVRFRRAGPLRYYDAQSIDLNVDDVVVVEADGRPSLGWVVVAPSQVSGSEVAIPRERVLGKATPDEVARRQRDAAAALGALEHARDLVRQRGLPVALLDASVSLDGTRLTLVYRAEAPDVDVAALRHELARRFRTRVTLRRVDPS